MGMVVKQCSLYQVVHDLFYEKKLKIKLIKTSALEGAASTSRSVITMEILEANKTEY